MEVPHKTKPQKPGAPARSWDFWASLHRAPVRWLGIAATAALVTTAIWLDQLQDSTTPLPSQSQIFRAEPQAPEPQTPSTSKDSSNPASSQSGIAAVRNSRQRFLLDPQTITAPGIWATGMLNPAPTSAPANVGRPKWMISPDGVLRRSLDNGLTWQAYAMQSGARLRAVVAIGRHVWVGGSNGILYHSTDLGQQWRRVIPISAQGRSFAGDVISLEFADAQNGTIITSIGDRWITADGGETWRLR
jgi:hypothetical protein